MAEIKLPDIRPAKTIEEKLDALYDAYYMMRKWLNYAFSGVLDAENVMEAATVKRLTAEQINVLDGIILGANATINWGELPSLPTPAQIGAISSTYIDENGVFTPQVYATNINVSRGKITTAQIENLVVGGNVTMGPNARISWSQVTNQPYIPTTADITTITANYIATPNLITNIAQVNNSLRLGSGATDAILTFRSGASIYSFNTVNGPYISFDVYGLQLLGNDIDCRGNWHFSDASVSGLENSGYVKQSNITAAIAAHVAAYHSS